MGCLARLALAATAVGAVAGSMGTSLWRLSPAHLHFHGAESCS